ncbi:exonuclease SbcCD subunit D [Natronoglycomyces albus]|uniref:Nuclease SbcCD subunit D n=1 Tax=Natronoglycomyces albus TaxID=2811108 RepID=A0A895XXJ5_9ACTN|nr:exonuclease SbcCD subunit D [Natronoglycomyces albus]QSB06348.1 exonuclease SbcCD subunit D [Natronoglycomyces albus]
MRILHTSDWHTGLTLKGQSRLDEQIAVFAQMVAIAREEKPDLVIVSGDLFDTAAPSAAAQKTFTRALSALRNTGADVVAIAGNHDSGAVLEAWRGWAEAAGISLRGALGKASDHVIAGTTAGGQRWKVAALPFISQRYALRAAELFALTAAEADQSYADHLRRLVAQLAQSFDDGEVNIITAHLTVVGGTLGAGEREVHTVGDYVVPAQIFPPQASYVALGHLHKAQKIVGPCPIHYAGAPIAVDFGEEHHQPSVTIVDVTSTTPARVRTVPLTKALPLVTVKGTLKELEQTEVPPEAWVRVVVAEAPRSGLRAAVTELFPRALQIQIDPVLQAGHATASPPRRAGRHPQELFDSYLTEQGHNDQAVSKLFADLYDDTQTVAAEEK